MEVINELILLPAAEHQGILPYLIGFMLLLHLPFVGAALVSSLVSLVFLRRNPDGAKTFAGVIPLGAATVLTFVVLPLGALIFLYAQYLYHQPISVAFYLMRIFPLALAGALLLARYQRRLELPAALAGIALTGAAAFLTVATLDLIAYPQKWSFITSLVPLVFSVTVVVHFKMLMAASVLLSGAAALFFLFRWPERRLREDSPFRDTARAWSLGMILAGSLGLPLLLLWDLYTLPDIALTARTYVSAFLLLALLLPLACWSVSMLRHRCHRFATAVFAGALLVSGLIIWQHEQFQSAANKETLIVLAQSSQKAMEEWRMRREALYAKAAKVDDKLGEKVFHDRCSACHRFDQKLVGPPYNEVLPKYADAPDKLQAFIRNPVKVNPAYPPMPNQGLSEPEVKSVAAYLLKQLAEKK